MNKKKKDQIDVNAALSNGEKPLKIRPTFIEFRVVADLSTEDGTFVENVAATDRITAINFNGVSVQNVIDKAMQALTEKYCGVPK